MTDQDVPANPGLPGEVFDTDLAALFRRRASRLAAPREEAETEGRTWVLTANVGAGAYALRLQHLAEVMPLTRWSRVPGWPPGLLGVAARRGAPVPIIDMHRLMGHAPPPAGRSFHVLLLRAQTIPYGLRVDALGDTRRVDLSRFATPGPAPDADDTHPTLVEGVDPDGLVLLDTDRLRRPDALLG